MAAPVVHQLVPMAHVVDVERSITFYSLLGFGVRNRLQIHGHTNWAWIDSKGAALMFARASGPIDPTQQAVLFYLYCPDVAELRRHLLASGLADGGAFCGQPGPAGPQGVVFDVTHPEYMPEGEIRVADPDGYCLLIGQAG